MIPKQEERRKRIYRFYNLNRNKGKIFTINHFKNENVVERNIYNRIKRAENDSGHQRVRGSGRVAKKMN